MTGNRGIRVLSPGNMTLLDLVTWRFNVVRVPRAPFRSFDHSKIVGRLPL